jgi:hypothetical protein
MNAKQRTIGVLVSESREAYELGKDFTMSEAERLEMLRVVSLVNKIDELPDKKDTVKLNRQKDKVKKLMQAFASGKFQWISDGYICYLAGTSLSLFEQFELSKKGLDYLSVMEGRA